MQTAMNDTYYRNLGRCAPMTRDEERARGAELARVRAERDALATKLESVDPEQWSAAERRALRSAQRAYETVRNEFVRANLRLVVKIAGQYRARRLALSDLIQEGNIGLMIAVDRFDPSRDVRFCTYAAWWIRHRVTRALANHGRAVRVPNHVSQTAQKLKQHTRELERQLGREPSLEELAAAADLPAKKVKLTLETTGRVLSLDASVGDEERSLLNVLAHDAPTTAEDIDTTRRAEDVKRVLAALEPLEADILKKRFAFDVDEPLTLRELGSRHRLSRERIRQIQNRALAKVKRELDHLRASA
ncbi:MAG: sigma-70 family RNA polymerase sigma factor [Polyangiaceae bacterium]